MARFSVATAVGCPKIRSNDISVSSSARTHNRTQPRPLVDVHRGLTWLGHVNPLRMFAAVLADVYVHELVVGIIPAANIVQRATELEERDAVDPVYRNVDGAAAWVVAVRFPPIAAHQDDGFVREGLRDPLQYPEQTRMSEFDAVDPLSATRGFWLGR